MDKRQKQVLSLSKLSNTKTALQLLASVGLAFILFSQLSVALRKNFSVYTYPVATYTESTANQIIWEIIDDTSVETKERSFLLAQRLLDSWSIITPKYLANFWDADGWELIRKNFELYFDGGYELASAGSSDDEAVELNGLINDISNKARRFGNYLNKMFIGSTPVKLNDDDSYYRIATHPITTLNGNTLATQNCLVKNAKKEWSISSAWICSRKGYYLALRAYLLENLDKEIAFPIKVKGKTLQLKKFREDWTLTEGYIEFQNYLEKTKIINIFHQNASKITPAVDKLNEGLKALASYELVFKDLFTLYDQSKNLSYEKLTLSAIGFQFSDTLPLLVRTQSWVVVKDQSTNTEENKDKENKEDKKETKDKKPEKEEKKTKKDDKTEEKKKELEYEFSDNGVMVLEVWENEKNNLNFEIMNGIFNNLKSPTIAYYKDIFFGSQYAQLNHDNSQINGCALTLTDGAVLSYPINDCDDIRRMLGIDEVANQIKPNGILEKAKTTVDKAFTESNSISSVRGINFSVPWMWILGVNKQGIWFWVKGLDRDKNSVKLVVKHFQFNFAWPWFDENNADNKNMMQIGSYVVQIIYFLLYFTLYYVFLSILSLGITALYNYRLNLKNGGGGLDESI